MRLDAKRVTANFRVTEPFMEKLRRQAKYERRTMTAIVMFAVEDYMRRHSVGSAGEQPTAKRRPK